jgi:uncharacterized membrane protein YeaQ/YmgE (transglycosylase-associated protein family)
MNVRLVLLLSLLGLVIGVASVAGVLKSGAETLAWCVIALLCGIVVARQVPSRHFLHGFLAGFIAGVLGPLVQVVFFDQYLANNPKAADSFARLPTAMSPRIMVVLLTPVVAACLGVFTGFLAWVAHKALGRKPAPTI